MNLLFWIIGFSVVGSLVSLLAAASYLLLPERIQKRTLHLLISFATGVLLGAALMGLLPSALEFDASIKPAAIMLTVLLGILVFFVLEKTLIWRHSHHGDEPIDGHSEAHQAGYLILVGDTFHNFLDGVLITAAFVTSIDLGIVTALAIIAHEIPQELGDFAILINSGFSRSKALLLNGLSSVAMVIGAMLAWLNSDMLQAYVPYLLAFTASSFIYIAVADLIPSLHRGVRLRDTLAQLLLIGAGILILAGLQHIVPH